MSRGAAKHKVNGLAGGPHVADKKAKPAGPGEGQLVAAFIVPGQPHPLLVPDGNKGYRALRQAYDEVRKEIERIDPDLLVFYSTQWLSVIGHQVQAQPEPEWVHVDQEWHELGSIPYKFRMDPEWSALYVEKGQARGLEMRTVAYHGFPIDTGTVVALKLLNPDNRYPASVVSCNMYADRSETIVLGKAARDAAIASGKRVVAIAVTGLSNRQFTEPIPFAKDRIHSLKDDEWNRKYLEFLAEGRLEDASQLAREFSTQANGDQRMKAIWWLSAVMGAHNRYDGRVYEYQPVNGTGAALVGLTPTEKASKDAEYDEDDVEFHGGDRNVLGGSNPFEAAEQKDMGVTARPGPAPADGPQIMQKGGAPAKSRRAAPPDDWPQITQITQNDDGSSAKSAKSAGSGVAAKSAASGVAAESAASGVAERAASGGASRPGVVHAPSAPKPLASYAHARRVGDLLFLAGIGPRIPATNEVAGGPIRDPAGKPLRYDVKAQARQVIANIRTILQQEGADLKDVFDVNVFLVDMQRDFQAFNEVYNEAFGAFQPTRTTVEVEALPGPIAVELKVVAQIPRIG